MSARAAQDDDCLTLERIYPLPRAFETLEEHERYQHHDLRRFTRAELLRERERVRLRLLLDDAPDPWFLQRLEKLRAALGDAR